MISSIPLGFCTQKSLFMDKFSYRFTSMFRPEKGVYIDCFINNIYINF
uniref:Uncharacterized protein n=1 Tax=virus sp. ctiha2 TaxID=2827299 RepID=A0A8S5RHI8_9VIRU|nr:MAG TPA: hypothetical protein [virus sp. ctiha2]